MSLDLDLKIRVRIDQVDHRIACDVVSKGLQFEQEGEVNS